MQGMSSDKSELEFLQAYMTEHSINSSTTLGYEQWRSSQGCSSREYKQIHLVLSREIVRWSQWGVDDVAEILTCLLILFSQQDGAHFSNKIGQIFDCWRWIIKIVCVCINHIFCQDPSLEIP